MNCKDEYNNADMRKIKNISISIDEYMGQKLRDFRERVGLTLIECSERMGVSHQQIHKYESGQTKISPGVLYKFCELFSVNPNAFFEGYTNADEKCHLNEEDVTSYENLQKINILLVEDNAEEQFLVRKIFDEYDLDIQIFCIHDGEEFLNIIKRKINITQIPFPDLIFIDLNMPKLDGIGTLKLLKQDKELRLIPVIILTGSMRVQDVINAYKNYASGYIRKSFDYEILKQHIHQALNYWTESVILPTQLNARNIN